MLGCSQRALRRHIEQRLDGRIEPVARESGGGAVLTGPWLVSASVVLPHRHPWVAGGLIDSYRRLGLLHADLLKEFGIPARALPPQDVAAANQANGFGTASWACFGSLSPWEVVDTGGRKLVGLAQRRRQSGVLLVAGTLIGVPDWSLLCDATGHPEDERILRQCTVSAAEIAAGRVDPEQFAAALREWLERALPANGEAD